MKTSTEIIASDESPDMSDVFLGAENDRRKVERLLELLPPSPPQGHGRAVTLANGVICRVWTSHGLCRFLATHLHVPWELMDGYDTATGNKHSWFQLYRRDMSLILDVYPDPDSTIGISPLLRNAKGSPLQGNPDPSLSCFTPEELEAYKAEAFVAESFIRK